MSGNKIICGHIFLGLILVNVQTGKINIKFALYIAQNVYFLTFVTVFLFIIFELLFLFDFLMIKKTILLLFLLSFTILPIVKGQDVIWLMNGRIQEGKVLNINESVVNYEYSKNNKTYIKELDTYRTFSILYGDGHTEILYTQDSAMGNDFSVAEMKYFILGEQDAYKYFKSPGSTLLGFTLAATGGVFVAESFLVLLVPFLSTGLHTIPGIHIRKSKVSNPDYLKEITYVQGYKRVAKNKRIQNAIKGSLIGVLAGIATYHVLNNNNLLGE